MAKTHHPTQVAEYDIFISHASQDEALAKDLCQRLEQANLKVWLDVVKLRPGDSLFAQIGTALNKSRFCVVILSPNFLRPWANLELASVVEALNNGQMGLIPVRHQLTVEEIGARWRLLSGLISIPTDLGLDQVVSKILDVTNGRRPGGSLDTGRPGHPSHVVGSPSIRTTMSGEVKEVRSRLDVKLKGQFVIETMVGRGETSIVFRARDITLNRRVAIKVLDRTRANGEGLASFSKRFRESTQYAASLTHNHILKVYAANLRDRSLPYIVLELVEGARLDWVIRAMGIQPFRKVRNLIRDIGGALDYANLRGCLHLNLRPSSIFIDKDGGPIIQPFRLWGWDAKAANRVASDLSVEKIKYLSPERFDPQNPRQVDPEARVTAASDQYALGLIAFEMITGDSIIPETDLKDVEWKKSEFFGFSSNRLEDLLFQKRPDCPPTLAEVVLKMLEVNPDQRWHDLEEAMRRLRQGMSASTCPLDKSVVEHMEEASRSYSRCRDSPTFFQNFYQAFFAINPRVEAMFPRDREILHYLLREALDLALQFPAESRDGTTTLSRVAASHAKMKINPALFDSFSEILIQVVKTHDPWFSDGQERAKALEVAWKETIKPAVEFMKLKANGTPLGAGILGQESHCAV